MGRKRLTRTVIAGALLAAGCAAEHEEPAEVAVDPVERGRYLTVMGGCHDCHSPKVFTERGPVPDESRLLSGHPEGLELPPLTADAVKPGGWIRLNDHLTAAVGPWGISYAMNLTPDEETGIGVWSEEIFIQAMRTGKHMGVGRPILPPMPWFNLAEASTEDLRAIFAYLQSLPPIKNRIPDPVPPGNVGS